MSATAGAGTARRPVPRIIAGAVFACAVVALAAWAAWPVYRDGAFLLLVAVAVPAGALIATLAWRGRWGGWVTAGALAVAFLVLAVPLAVPSRRGDPLQAALGLGEAASGVLFAWKDLVTVDLPVGAYRNLLVPALLVFLVGTCALLLLAWRGDRVAYAAVAVAAAMLSFGLFFGRTTVSAALRVGPLTLPAPVETALGIGGLLSCLLWLAWRSRDQRVRALRRAAQSSGVRPWSGRLRGDRRRGALAAGMLAVAVLAAAVVVPFAARGSEREVLRSSVGPEVALRAAVSPLAQYRALFSDARADDVLFTVTADGALPDRVRLATLDSYDGEIYRSGGIAPGDGSRFVRVPSMLEPGGGRPVQVRIVIDQLDGIWMPTVGRLATVEFSGPRAAILADRFYYRSAAAAGVQTAGGGWEPADAYRLTAVEPDLPDLASITPPPRAAGTVELPRSLRTWVDRHAAGADGAALSGLVALLRERGYLSHALTIGDRPPLWMQSLPGYSFQPSASGHSLARIDALFTRLLEREADARASTSGNLVAAVGDDEQFAAAVALIAQELGFPSRVVLGARLASADPAARTCQGGVCRAQDVSAWAEVQAATGQWVPVDATPQSAVSPSLQVSEQQNPENVTEVRPEAVEDVVPPDPVQEDSGADDRVDRADALDLSWLWPALRVAGIVLLALLVVAGPFAVIAAAKAARRRSRRGHGEPAARIAGGWDEYVDAAVDSGRDAPAMLTRTELAARYDTPAAQHLAREADRAAFSGSAPSESDAVAFWRIVDHERRVLLRERGAGRGILATVSLRSIVRSPAPSGSGSRSAERGSAGALRPRTSP